MSNRDSDDEELELAEGAGEGSPLTPDTVTKQMTKEVGGLMAWLYPSFEGTHVERLSKLLGMHWLHTIFWIAALIASAVVVAQVHSLSVARNFLLWIGVVTPPAVPTGNDFQDAFAVTQKSLSTFPPTVLFCVIPAVNLVYHSAHGWFWPSMTDKYLRNRSNVWRWICVAGNRILELILFFVWNGERSLVLLLVLSGAVLAICMIAYNFDWSVACYWNAKCKAKKKKDKESAAWIEHCSDIRTSNGHGIFFVLLFILVPFALHLGYNKQATLTYILALSIVWIILYGLSPFWYVYNGWQAMFHKKVDQTINYARNEWLIAVANAVQYTALLLTIFIKQNQI